MVDKKSGMTELPASPVAPGQSVPGRPESSPPPKEEMSFYELMQSLRRAVSREDETSEEDTAVPEDTGIEEDTGDFEDPGDFEATGDTGDTGDFGDTGAPEIGVLEVFDLHDRLNSLRPLRQPIPLRVLPKLSRIKYEGEE